MLVFRTKYCHFFLSVWLSCPFQSVVILRRQREQEQTTVTPERKQERCGCFLFSSLLFSAEEGQHKKEGRKEGTFLSLEPKQSAHDNGWFWRWLEEKRRMGLESGSFPASAFAGDLAPFIGDHEPNLLSAREREIEGKKRILKTGGCGWMDG